MAESPGCVRGLIRLHLSYWTMRTMFWLKELNFYFNQFCGGVCATLCIYGAWNAGYALMVGRQGNSAIAWKQQLKVQFRVVWSARIFATWARTTSNSKEWYKRIWNKMSDYCNLKITFVSYAFTFCSGILCGVLLSAVVYAYCKLNHVFAFRWIVNPPQQSKTVLQSPHITKNSG